MFKPIAILAVACALAACTPPKPVTGPGKLGLIMDMTTTNAGQCDLVGPGLSVNKSRVLGGDYFVATGNLLQSTLRCTLADGRRVHTTSHRQIFDTGEFHLGGLIIGPVFGPGEVKVFGYSEGPNGKVDTQGTFVFESG